MQYIINILIGIMVGVISQGLSETGFVLMVFGFLLMIIVASTSTKDFLIKAAIFSFLGMFIGYNFRGNILRGANFSEDYMLWANLGIQSACMIIGTYLVKTSVKKSNYWLGIIFIIISIVLFCMQTILPNINLR